MKGPMILLLSLLLRLHAAAQEEPLTFVEQPPVYPGGEEALSRFLASFRLNNDSLRDGELHTVLLSFIIQKNGKVTDVKPLSPRHTYLERAVTAHVQKMPAWKPGRQKGKAVPVRFNLPVRMCFTQD